MRGWFESTFGAGALAAQIVVALIVVIVLFGIIAAFARRRKKNAGPRQARGRQPRLAVMDMANVDDRRRLLLIRRDNVEHLVMIGGPSDLVIESTIVRNRPAPHAAERTPGRAPDRVVAALATQAHSRAQVRAPSVSPAGPEAASQDEPHAAPPLHSPQFVNPYKTPDLAATDTTPSPAATPAEPAQSASPAFSPAAVAGLAAGAAALTAAAAAKIKRGEPSQEVETPPAKPAKAPPVMPVGLNGSEGPKTPSADATPDVAPDAAPDAAPEIASAAGTPEPAEQPEPVVSEEAAKAAAEPDATKAADTATEPDIAPVATADAANEQPPAADAQTGTQTAAAAESDQKAAVEPPSVETPAEPVAATEPAPAKNAEMAGDTGPGGDDDEGPGESQPKEAEVADAADQADIEDNLEAALAEALASPQDQSAEVEDTPAAAAEPAPAEPVDAAAELTGAAKDATAETATDKSSEAAAGLIPDKSFEEIMADNAGGGDPGIGAAPQADVPASPEPQAPAPSSDGEADTADQTAEPAAEPPAAVSPFPTIPEAIRRSVLEAAQRASQSPDASSGSADGADTVDGAVKTTLGDLAERLEHALAEQASTLSGQLKSDTDEIPAPGPAENRDASIEEWERGELASPDAQAPDGPPPAAVSADADPEAAPDAAPRQSQAMLEDETDPGVIDFSDRKKPAPNKKPSDTLEDEMARLLGELTSGKSGR